MNAAATQHSRPRVPEDRDRAEVSGEITPETRRDRPRRDRLRRRPRRASGRLPADLPEKRRHGRHGIARQVRFRGERHAVSTTDSVRDLSTSGMFIRTLRPIAPGSVIRGSLRYDVDGDAGPIRFAARVVWSTQFDNCFTSHGPGVGLCFVHLTDHDRDRLALLLEQEADC